MKTKKSIIAAPMKLVSKAIKSTKNIANIANGFALNATEEIVSESLIVAEQWQTVANKAIEGGLKLSATQQDIVFDTLAGFKRQFKSSKKQFTKLIA